MSTRDITSAALAAAGAKTKVLLAFVDFDFTSGFRRFTNAPFDVAWNGFTWQGVGALGQIGERREVLGVESNGQTYRLSGIDTNTLATATTEKYQGRASRMWMAFIASGAIVIDPVLLYAGRIDVMTIERSEKTASITVNVEDRFSAWDKPKIRRFSDADQQAEFPGDLGFSLINTYTAGVEVVWGTT